MKKLSLTLAAVFAATSMTAFAAPMQMSEAEMDKIVAGADYDVYVNRGGNYAIKLSGEPPKGMGAFQETISCSDDGTGSCGFGGKDFSWNADKGRWH